MFISYVVLIELWDISYAPRMLATLFVWRGAMTSQIVRTGPVGASATRIVNSILIGWSWLVTARYLRDHICLLFRVEPWASIGVNQNRLALQISNKLRCFWWLRGSRKCLLRRCLFGLLDLLKIYHVFASTKILPLHFIGTDGLSLVLFRNRTRSLRLLDFLLGIISSFVKSGLRNRVSVSVTHINVLLVVI